MRVLLLPLVLLLAIFGETFVSGSTIFVDPVSGSNENAGTAPDEPLATIAAALTVVSKIKGPAMILLAGKVVLNETLTFPRTARDLIVTQWPGKSAAVISGGIEVPAATWTRSPGSDGVWSARLTDVAATALSYTSAGSIFIGEARRHIVRTPTLRWKTSLGAKGSKASRSGFIVGEGVLNSSWSLSPASLAQWRVGAYHSWTKAFHTVKSVDISTGTIMFGEASMFGYGEYTYCSDYRFYIEGVPELELTPGSFRVIRGVSSSRLEYRPLSGEEFPQSVTVPVVSTLLQLSGVHNITMSNLILEHTSGGDCHSDPRVPACDADEGLVAHSAMVIEGKADTVKLSSLTFRGLGGFALFATNVASLIVERVGAIDVGSGGIFVRSCPGVLVNNSIVRNYGQRFAAGPGITMDACLHGTVSHCDVSGGIFAGLAGGGINDSGAYSVFELNHVHSNGRETDDGLCDFGGYHGANEGSVLPSYMRSNIFHNITAFANGGSGMYFDVSSTAWQVSRNLVYDVTNSAIHWNVNPGVAQAWAAGAEPMRFTNNVLIAERDNAFYRSGANHTRGGTSGPWGLGNAAIKWNGYTPSLFSLNVVVVDASAAPSRGAWFEGLPCKGDKLGSSPAGVKDCSWDLGDNFWAANLSANVWFNRTRASGLLVQDSVSSSTFPGGCSTTASSCGSVHGCACRSWADWQATGEDLTSMWQEDPDLKGPLRVVTSPAALALGIEPLTELANAGADWNFD